MINVQSLNKNRRRNALIGKIEKNIYLSNEFEENTDFASEALIFCRSNAPIVLMNLKSAVKELKNSVIRASVHDWAQKILNQGNEAISRESLFSSINDLDDKINLRSAEFFKLKDLLSFESCQSFETAFSEALIIQNTQTDAEIWMNENGKRLESDNVFFLEHALKLSRDQDDPEKRELLLHHLSFIGKTEDDVVEIYSKAISDLLLKLTNSVSFIHLLNNIDWMDAYETLSHTEKILMSDPGNVYPKMDEESKAAFRQSLEKMSIHSGFSENSISSVAVALIREGAFSDVTEALYTDHGREAVLNRLNPNLKPVSKIIPDPDGKRLILTQACGTGALFALSLFKLPFYISVILIPVFWALVLDLSRFFVSKKVKTNPLLSLKTESVPEESRTLVVIPALLTSRESALKIVNRLHEHGVHETDENIDFLLLGDFKDSENVENESDFEITKAASDEIEVLNRESGRRKYFYLQRARSFNESDKLWMGRERKRGAIEDLNRLIVTGENRFCDADETCDFFFERYTYLLTMDSDTRILPGEIRKLIGTIAHPLNRKYSVIQPRMETIHDTQRNLFSECMSGIGGTDHYDVCASDYYQDLTGEGLFSGKGILRIRTFYEKTNEAFQENTVLSHDMIEGILTKAAFAGNRVMFESFPSSIESYLKRLDRWTRGDWQLIHYLFGRIRLTAFGRFKILSNLIRSLKSVSVILAITVSFWRTDLLLLMLSLFSWFLPVILNGIGAISSSIMSFLLLPSIAYTELRAAVTAVIRLYVTKRKRLEWTTAAESLCASDSVNLPGIFVSLFLIPGLFNGKTTLFALLIGLSFAFGKSVIAFLTRTGSEDTLSLSDYGYLMDLSKSIWKYFEKYVPLNGNGLPPDNVQLDPFVGEQIRTSPTNIGMYILSAIGANVLGLIETCETVIRLKNTLHSLKSLETHNGLFFNWYDSQSMKPVFPRYVSSVDLGNLMAACVSARNYLKDEDSSLSKGFQDVIDQMNLSFLYNERRKLFRIGYDVENDRLSASHYDLFASEARILSYTAMAEKGIDLKHWKHLGRPFALIGKKPVVLSWSGTMFEYMMPNLFLPSTSGSLVKNTEKCVVDIQRKRGKDGLWGISESGYAAFDRNLNYQYQAFGVSDLALSGESSSKVYSPYSVLLSMEHAGDSGVRCLESMSDIGLRGDFGFYEAIDMRKDDHSQIIYSYMTHHQGMSFVSLVNLLTDNKMKTLYLDHPKESALMPLLSEKPFCVSLGKVLFSGKSESIYQTSSSQKKIGDYARYANKNLNEGHLLFAGDALAYFEMHGRSFFRKDKFYANRFSVDSTDENDSLLPKISDKSGDAIIRKCLFDTGYVKYELSTKLIEAKITFTLNPENQHLLLKTEIHSITPEEISVVIDHRFVLSLTDEESMYAHPVFADLFIREKPIDSFGKMYLRKDRDTLKEDLILIHLTDGEFSDEKQNTHAKHACLKREIKLPPYKKRETYFEIGIENDPIQSVCAPAKAGFERASILLRAQMNAHIQFCGLKASEYRQADRNSANLFSLSAKTGNEIVDPTCLWPLGISGDTPILLSCVTQKSSLNALRKLIRTHEFYRYANLPLPLVIVHVFEPDYFTPLTDAIRQILSSSHLAGMKEAYVFSLDELTVDQKIALEALSVISVKSDFLKDAEAKKRKQDTGKTFEEIEIIESWKNTALIEDNGYGGFLPDQSGYRIYMKSNSVPPRRWSNFLANAVFGAMTNDLGIAHIYYENSRMGRITPFENNLDLNKPTVELFAIENGKKLSLMPGQSVNGAYTVTFKPGETVYSVETKNFQYETTCFTDIMSPLLYVKISAHKKSKGEDEIRFASSVRYLMGTDKRDLRFTRLTSNQAYGKCGFTAFSEFLNKQDTLTLKEGDTGVTGFVLGAYKGNHNPYTAFKDIDQALNESRTFIRSKFEKTVVDTGNRARDQLINGFMKAQTLFSRFHARFGPYQPGGAFGMRDQMQDLLSIMYFDLCTTRKHLLLCASRQFEKGDALHWWHMPSSGVRTRISDDILFLPFVTAKYIELSGDKEILNESVPFLKDIPIPDDHEDLYRSFEETDFKSTLYDHIMRAFRYVNRRGSHNLLLMGTGDWNDGMNRIGHNGKGESVWLSEFFLCAVNAFAPYANHDNRRYLESEANSLRIAIETHAWDGEWYIRAFDDEGRKIGSKECAECKIDLITQTWAVISGLDEERSISAIRSCEKYLIDEEAKHIRLLTPPFTGKSTHPGYISAYPGGVRENGGQYTHAACWLVKAYAHLGLADKAWNAFDMLLPINRTNTKEKAITYGGEPYVIAADISDNEDTKGVCGWTWYTGAAAWAERVLIEDLMGVSIREKNVTMRALLPAHTDSMSITIKTGDSTYKLTAKRNSKETFRTIELIDDGLFHEFEFPVRE